MFLVYIFGNFFLVRAKQTNKQTNDFEIKLFDDFIYMLKLNLVCYFGDGWTFEHEEFVFVCYTVYTNTTHLCCCHHHPTVSTLFRIFFPLCFWKFIMLAFRHCFVNDREREYVNLSLDKKNWTPNENGIVCLWGNQLVSQHTNTIIKGTRSILSGIVFNVYLWFKVCLRMK